MANYLQSIPSDRRNVPTASLKKFLRNPQANDKGKTVVLGFQGAFNDAQLKRANKSSDQYARELTSLIAAGDNIVNAHWVGFMGLAHTVTYNSLKTRVGGLGKQAPQPTSTPKTSSNVKRTVSPTPTPLPKVKPPTKVVVSPQPETGKLQLDLGNLYSQFQSTGLKQPTPAGKQKTTQTTYRANDTAKNWLESHPTLAMGGLFILSLLLKD